MIKAQLAETLIKNQLEKVLTSNEWAATPKLDGHRLLIVIENGEPHPLNRRGETFKNRINPRLLEELTGPQWNIGRWVLDGEYMADVDQHFYVFDLIETPMGSLVEQPYNERQLMLEALFMRWQPMFVHLVPSVVTEHGKRDMLSKIEAAGGEGVIFKRLDDRYWPGRRSDGTLKWKLWKEIDCIVAETWQDGKHSIKLALYDNPDIGSCTMSDKNLSRVSVGDIVSIKYLYCGKGLRLYQPSFIRVRTDKLLNECTTDQLEHVNKILI